jgi:hypothetical protein
MKQEQQEVNPEAAHAQKLERNRNLREGSETKLTGSK